MSTSIDYSKADKSDEEHIRYFLKLPIIGWYEVDQETYRDTAKKAMPPGAWGLVNEPESFNSGGIQLVQGYRVTARNGRKLPESYGTFGPSDVESGQPEVPSLPPKVERLANCIVLTFPEGSYSDYYETDGALVLTLSAGEYQALGKAQTPVSLENIATKISEKPVPEDSLRETLRDGAVEVLQEVAKSLRDGKAPESPLKGATAKLRAVRDLLK
jgi:hypothetical protein